MPHLVPTDAPTRRRRPLLPTARSTSRPRGTRRSRGQALVELALVTPLLLLLFAAAADLGRAFYAYVAVENAAKEGALFGSRAPLCDASTGGACTDPNNVTWHVQQELQNLRMPDGTTPVPTVQCLDASNGAPRTALKDCAEGDTYAVGVQVPFKMLTPVLGSLIGNLQIASTSRAVVLNLAFDPSPGLSVQKFVQPTGAINASAITSKCLDPNDRDAAGYYRSPCLDLSTPDPTDKLWVHFEQGDTIAYKIALRNTGAQNLSGITVVDSRGSTGCSFPTSLAAGSSAFTCTYTRTAPTVSGVPDSMDYANTVTVDSSGTLPSQDGVTVVVERPPAEFQVLKWVSPFKEGDDGDGTPGFGTQPTVAVSYSAQIPQPAVWFKVIVRNVGGRTASAVAIADSHGALPYGQNNATAVCDAAPTSLAANGIFQCRYRVTYASAQVATNTVSATSPDVTPDSNDTATATATVTACTGATRVVPDLIGLAKAAAQTAWTSAGFTGTLSVWSGQPSATVVTQTRPAYGCIAANSTMTIGRTTTP